MTSLPPDLHAVMEAAVATATLAPSVHNTQPWHFTLADDRIEMRADLARKLDVLDPTGRQLYVSCGAALHHLTLALRAEGIDSSVALLPDDSPDHLATIVVSEGAAPTAAEQALKAAVAERHTQREPFDGRRVDHETLALLRRAAEAEGAWLALLESREDQITLAVLQSHADQLEVDNPAYQAELQAWRRSEPSPDGIPGSAVPRVGNERHSEVVVRDFEAGAPESDAAITAAAEADHAALPDERPALVILGTDSDTPSQWLRAGQALSHLLLEATVLGLRASMLGQVIDLPGTRDQVRRLLRLVGEPQMVLRIGYGPLAPATPRRPLSEVVNS